MIGFLTDRTGTYAAGIYYLMASGVLGGMLVLFLRAGRRVVAPRRQLTGSSNH
jgi:hypothetical protein